MKIAADPTSDVKIRNVLQINAIIFRENPAKITIIDSNKFDSPPGNETRYEKICEHRYYIQDCAENDRYSGDSTHSQPQMPHRNKFSNTQILYNPGSNKINEGIKMLPANNR